MLSNGRLVRIGQAILNAANDLGPCAPLIVLNVLHAARQELRRRRAPGCREQPHDANVGGGGFGVPIQNASAWTITPDCDLSPGPAPRRIRRQACGRRWPQSLARPP
jgi:hypothetical protein